MEKERGIKIIAVIALCLAIAGLGVGFAAFSATLNVSGTAEVKASSWEVKFSNLGEVVEVGQGTEVSAPVLTDTTISDFSVSLMAAGDSVSYTFDIVNNGTFNAVISEAFEMPTPICTGSGANAETDALNVCNNLEYTLTYVEGGTAVTANDTLDAGQTRAVKLMIALDEEITEPELPLEDVDISNLGFSIVYNQQ